MTSLKRGTYLLLGGGGSAPVRSRPVRLRRFRQSPDQQHRTILSEQQEESRHYLLQVASSPAPSTLSARTHLLLRPVLLFPLLLTQVDAPDRFTAHL